MSNIRTNLKTFLLSQPSITSRVGNRITSGARATGGELPAIVFRVLTLNRGEELRGDSGERNATFEIVVWAATQEECFPLVDALNALFHAENQGRFALGDMYVNSSSNLKEYDGDRVLDVFSDEGAEAITTVIEFIWDE